MKSIFNNLYFFNLDKLPKYSNQEKRLQRLLIIIYFFVFSIPIVILSDSYLAITGKQDYTFEKYPVIVFWALNIIALWSAKNGKYLIAKVIVIFVPLIFISSYAAMNQIIGEHFLWQPILLIGLSIIPYLILDYKTEKGWIIAAFISFFLYNIFHDQILQAGSDESFIKAYNRLNTTPFIYYTVRVLIFFFLSIIIYYAIRLNDRQQLITEEMNDSLVKTGKYLEEANAELHAHRKAIDTSASLVITDSRHCIESANDDFLAITGYERDELRGRDLPEIFFDDDEKGFFSSILPEIKVKKVWRGELKIMQKGKKFVWMNTAISTISGPDDRQKRFLFLMFNITPLKDHEEQLEKLNHEKDRILYAVAHDLKSPLLNLKALVNLLQSGSMSEKDVQEIFRLMTKECEHSTNLMAELLEIGRLEDNRFVMAKSPTILKQFLEKALLQFEQTAAKKKITFKTSFDPAINTVDINEIEFTRVAYNLISNALKFTPDGGEIRLATRYVEKSNDRYVSIEISDTGVGISMDLLPIIFDKFSKASRTGVSGEESTGLGMWIVKHIVELHGGEINVSSRENTGTKFTILLPA